MKCTNCDRTIRDREASWTDDLLGKIYLCDCCDSDIAQTIGELEDKKEKVRYRFRQARCCLNCKFANDKMIGHECSKIGDIDYSTVCDLFEWYKR
jgi:hypothetical protein